MPSTRRLKQHKMVVQDQSASMVQLRLFSWFAFVCIFAECLVTERKGEREKIRREGERVCVCSPLGLMLIN